MLYSKTRLFFTLIMHAQLNVVELDDNWFNSFNYEDNEVSFMKRNVTSVQSVDRALRILEILQGNPKGLGVTDISYRLDVSKSTSYRLLTSLYNRGYVKQDETTELYKLGLKLIHLGQSVSDHLDIVELSKPYLQNLSNITGETAHLAVMEGHKVVYID